MALGEDVSRWRYLADEAKAGRLYLDKSVAQACRDACSRQIDLYDQLRDDLQWVSKVGGFGRFDCADELAKMLGGKAIGGEGDVDSALKEHIEVLTLMRDTIQVSVDRIGAVDETNAQNTNTLLS
ncbi:hypothetical protein OHA40_06250 [Nocardia sp. NBC_00508]|uniref:hypothetical protein n=1 Tax=Nocardia sp. NBC_00508 TaxID=2975992 RepID=UPI002E802CE5|nr:hypothetical protein [Nocardia sp. NBC_00508]WUD67727.1 hypothetical protein OHA40_06250 [Nocardia sp. NBC_00508]